MLPRARRKLSSILDEEGPTGLLRFAWARLTRRLYLHETHFWYELPLQQTLLPAKLSAPLRCERANGNAARIAAETCRDVREVKQVLDDGHEMWLVTDGDSIVFSCFVYTGLAPVLAARSHRLRLPEGTFCIEDVITSRAARGRGIMPATMGLIARELCERGAQAMIIKVPIDNVASQRGCEKAGFEATGVMDMRRIGSHYRVRFLDPGGLTGPILAAELQR